jgi:hypothetical protein
MMRFGQPATRRRSWSVVAVAVVAVGMVVTGTGSASSATPVRKVAVPPAMAMAAGAETSSVTKSRSVERDVTDGTTTTAVDTRTVSITVAQTTDLKSLQRVQVTWKGAMPTAGVTPDPNSDFAQNEEHSFVLLECRGIDSTSVPASQRLSQKTCWTQYADERFQLSYDDFPAWRSDLYATPSDRAAIANQPSAKDIAPCESSLFGSAAQYWVPFIGADGTTYQGGPAGCAGQPPEANPTNLTSLALPSNETFGVTALDGTGQALFDVFTGEDHASLGCSQTVACSLVAIPIEGISCDPSGALSQGKAVPPADELADATAACESAGNYQAGQPLPVGRSGDPAVDGSLWWSASNWRNRISIPLTFAPPDNACSLTSSLNPLLVYGSELMSQATTQWAPYFCVTKKLFDLQHVHTSEPQARNLLSLGNVEAAFSSDVPLLGYPNPTVSAPVAVTGFGIAVAVDDSNGNPVVGLKLDARLLAKLLTESYPDQTFIRDPYPVKKDGTPTLSKNPLNMSLDPEFQALNPGLPHVFLDTASTLLNLNTDSDVVYALTSYIESDPEARSFIEGQPDPWGMRVNPNYQGISLPVSNWPVLDTFVPTAEYQPGKIDCLIGNNTPYLPLVASPTGSLFNIGQDMEYGISQAQTTCVLPSPIPGDLTGAHMAAQGREAPGKRFMLGLVSLGDAAREGLSLASLQSLSATDPGDQFSTPAGRTFVAPTSASLQAAASMFVEIDFTDNTKVWVVDYDLLRQLPIASDAYPGTLPVYASVPTSGLPKQDAADYAAMLRFMAGPGQVQGTQQGELPAGYLPMTSANGLGALADYTEKAADLVAAQATTTPTGGHSGSSGAGLPEPVVGPTSGSGGRSSGGGSGASSNSGAGGGGGVSSTPTSAAPKSPTRAASSTATPPPKTIAAKPVSQSTPLYSSALGGALLPVALGIIAACAVGLLGLRLYRRFS